MSSGFRSRWLSGESGTFLGLSLTDSTVSFIFSERSLATDPNRDGDLSSDAAYPSTLSIIADFLTVFAEMLLGKEEVVIMTVLGVR